MTGQDYARFDDANFDAAVLRRLGLTVVDFWAEWCAPCKQMSRLLDQLVPELPDGALIETRTGVDRRQVIKKVIAAHA